MDSRLDSCLLLFFYVIFSFRIIYSGDPYAKRSYLALIGKENGWPIVIMILRRDGGKG